MAPDSDAEREAAPSRLRGRWWSRARSLRRRHPQPTIWLVGAATSFIVGLSIGALLGLPSADQQARLLLAAAAVSALAAGCWQVWRQRRRELPRRRDPAIGATPPAKFDAAPGQPIAAAIAYGGPCHGYPILVPTGPLAPPEVWIADARPGRVRHHRYVLRHRRNGAGRYVYAPPPEPPHDVDRPLA